LVDANLYILPHIDERLGGSNNIKKLIKQFKNVGNSLIVFFVQGNSENKGHKLIDKMDELLQENGIDLKKLNYLWYDLSFIDNWDVFKRRIYYQYQKWSPFERTLFDNEARQFVDHCIEYIYRELDADGYHLYILSEDEEVKHTKKRVKNLEIRKKLYPPPIAEKYFQEKKK
jgi:hypothetical protein